MPAYAFVIHPERPTNENMNWGMTFWMDFDTLEEAQAYSRTGVNNRSQHYNIPFVAEVKEITDQEIREFNNTHDDGYDWDDSP